jgi:hypothetical protein
MTRCLHEMDSIMGNDAMLRNKERELEQEVSKVPAGWNRC